MSLLLSALFVTTAKSAMTGPAIILKMENVYAHLTTYSDTGTGADGIRFRTTYKAPGKLFFEYRAPNEFNYFCASGTKGKATPEPGFPPDNRLVWMADAWVQGKVERDSLELEIAGFTGISRGTAYNVPTMLFPTYAGRHYHDSADAKLLRVERFGNEPCYVVDSKHDQTTLWIAQKTFALLKVEERDFDPTEVTIYHPTLNGKVDESLFKFRKPKGE